MTESWDKQENRTVNMLVLLTLLSYLIGSVVLSFVEEPGVQLVLVQVFCLLPGFLYVATHRGEENGGKTFAEVYRVHKTPASVCLMAAIMMLFLMPLLTLVNLVSQMFTNYVASVDIMGRIQEYPFLISLLCVGILPAIGEELLYRGLLYGHYRKRSVLMGALLTGLVFGLMHGNLNQMAYALLMGIIFALVDEASGSTVTSMVMHAFVNCSSVIIIYAGKWFQSSEWAKKAGLTDALNEAANEDVTLTWQSAIGYVVFAAVGTYFAYRIYQAIAIRCGTEEKLRRDMAEPGRMQALRDMFTAPLTVAIVIMIALLIAAEVMVL